MKEYNCVSIKHYLQTRGKKKILQWGDQPGLPRCTQCNHRSPYERKREARESEGNVLAEVEVRVMGLLTVKMKEGQEPRNANSIQKSGKAKNRFSHLSSRKNPALQTPCLQPSESSDFQKYKIINLYCVSHYVLW